MPISGRERSSQGKNAGFTLVEIVIATTIVTGVFAAALGLVVSGSQAVESGVRDTRLRNQVREVLSRIERDLRSARVEAVVDPAVLRFRKFHGSYEDGHGSFDFDEGEIRWDLVPLQTYRWEPESNELLNGKDDDFDGLVDEGRLVLLRGGERSVLATNVPRNGFVYRLVSPRRLAVSLTLEEIGDVAEGPVSVSADSTVFLRN